MAAPGSQHGHATRLRQGTYSLLPDENLVQFVLPGTYLWQPPPGLQAVRIIYVDAGAGGGSGRVDVTATARGGAGGGGGGASGDLTILMADIRPVSSRDLFQSWTINVGRGGLGGAALVNVAAANGNAGAAGGRTSIDIPRPLSSMASYRIIPAGAAGGGTGGTATSAAGGAGGNGQMNGQVGATGASAGAAGGAPTAMNNFGAGGGGSGGGLTTGNVESAGGSGGLWNQSFTNLLVTAPVAGPATGGRGADAVPGPAFGRWGTGAAGGGSHATLVAGNGGDGVIGSGGGGGGAGLATTGSSGAGGKGGDGALFLLLIW